jgi:hypothetical protein
MIAEIEQVHSAFNGDGQFLRSGTSPFEEMLFLARHRDGRSLG